MAKTCPQRIIKEAIRLLEFLDYSRLSEVDGEALDNCIHELDGLEKALYRDGIINVEEYHG